MHAKLYKFSLKNAYLERQMALKIRRLDLERVEPLSRVERCKSVHKPGLKIVQENEKNVQIHLKVL